MSQLEVLVTQSCQVSINTGVKQKTGKDVSEHVVQSLDKPLDCTLANSNELDAVFFNDYGNFDCHLVENQ
jgi:hypothetical protein